ncbi:diguanylate cyclase [Legionella longbeachae]|uniref:Thaumarchaeal output domain-containing protein n=3 Tax=Legionella longbeachae TaxID=450 RepID=D3HPC8_LEGLN|nr:diguanylate cyclase [Legionella longbeachae]VEE01267.1 Uncharacterised protein [Legionella oakridgensis]HBD7398296.1 diguanylate cyclase [Legionella pneumophila]ARB92366.1 GGDEF domain-containing protein [Legionella longbeachae]EEZ96258.1 conserved hypothetical protein [Legionella longbeachae D-4968]QEY50397.1 diguanylate cyclase [Legionella longbeachae]
MYERLVGYFISQNLSDTIIDKPIETIANIEQLPQSGCSFVVFNSNDESFDYSLITKVRQKTNYELIPIFYLGKEDPFLNQIIDGIFNDDSLDIALKIQEKIISINEYITNIDEFESLLIYYAYVRNDFVISCKLNYHNPAGFYYPLLAAFNFQDNSTDSWRILENMESRKLLVHHQIVDEIQSCPHCYSGLLNFKNCCPNCESSNITTKSFVHCFTCGNIAPLSDFLHGHALTCIRCQSTLRHIGIDYDKPMEDKICETCKSCFFEENVKALCMVCSKLTPPENLESRKLYEYTLASRGQAIAQGVDKEIMVEAEQFLKLTELSVFMLILTWQLLLARRHAALHFSLISLSITNEDELVATYGMLKTEQLTLEFFERIRVLLRDSDLIARDDNVLVFLLPMTPAQNCITLLERIQSFTQKQQVGNLNIKINLTMMHSSELLEKNISKDLVLNELYNSELKKL